MRANQSTESWQRMWAIYHGALEQPAERRGSFVAREASDDDALRTEVLSLLASRDMAGEGFLNQPRSFAAAGTVNAPELSDAPLTGRRIGRYAIGRLLAEGGSAVVYEAQQFDPPKSVALKIIRTGLGSGRRQQRFEFEGEILARLNHPGIAQVYETGTFDAGEGRHSYFAMELVRGVPLTEFAAARSLSTRERVQLLISLCDAVHHAHMRGVIHRDLKPSNILVEQHDADGTGAAAVKVLDFGVSQLTDGDLNTTRATAIHEVAGTLPYMSPEQVGGDPRAIDARSDVYALGVLAYQLLSSRHPLAFESGSLFDAIRIIREREPVRLGQVDARLSGDLELIVHKALHKEAGERYQSAADMAADQRRWLNCEPIDARPATWRYRLTRFCQRNKALVGGLAVAMLALIVGAGAATWQAVEARRAERLASTRADNALALATSVIGDLQAAFAAIPETTAAQAQLVAETIRFLDNADNQLDDNADWLLTSGKAHTLLARALGNVRGPSLNDTLGAISEYEQAIARLSAAARLDPDRAEVRYRSGLARMGLTDALRAVKRGDDAIDQGFQSAQDFASNINGQASVDSLECVGMYRLSADIAREYQRTQAAADAMVKARAIVDSLRTPPASETTEQLYLAQTWAEFGRQQFEAGDGGALESLTRAQSIIAGAADHGADPAQVRQFSIDAIRSTYDVHAAANRWEDARLNAHRCAELCRAVLAEGPEPRYVRSILRAALRHESESNLALGNHRAAVDLAREHVAESVRIRSREPSAGYFIGLEWTASVWFLHALVPACEQPASPDLVHGWIAEARSVSGRIRDLESAAAVAGVTLTDRPEEHRTTLVALQARLDALSR